GTAHIRHRVEDRCSHAVGRPVLRRPSSVRPCHFDGGAIGQRGLAAQLPRASGQREDRYMHLLSGELDVEALQAAAARAAPSARSGSDSSDLDARMQALEATVAELQEALAAVQARLDAAGA
ncbi:hypothetical protein P2C75_19990, partial [Xanthomonas perforans]